MKTVVDLSKVQYASFGWRNQAGHIADTKPRKPTHNAFPLHDDIMMPQVETPDGRTFPAESELARARRRGFIDIWEPVCALTFASNHNVCYTGKRAQSIWKEWNRRQFKK